ncbi:MAG: hypothetical protein ACOZDY_11045 [Pseudomonadota bacterium]
MAEVHQFPEQPRVDDSLRTILDDLLSAKSRLTPIAFAMERVGDPGWPLPTPQQLADVAIALTEFQADFHEALRRISTLVGEDNDAELELALAPVVVQGDSILTDPQR